MEGVFFPDYSSDVQDMGTFKATRANKVTVVGVGQVGMACAYSILTQVSLLFISSRFA
jgi:hypothetical protein